MKNTISIHVGNTSSIIHNNRKTNKHTNADIDVSRSGNNIVLIQENIKVSYEKLFGQAVDEYNKKQKRKDRKINNYLQKVKDSTLDHQKEFIMQIGDYQSLEKIAEEQQCHVWETKEWQLRAETLKQAVLDFQVKNPNLYVYNAIIHLDELNPHAHVNFIPVGENMRKGMSKQVSMNKALENMGYGATFEVSAEAKNVKERGRVKLDNSQNFKQWREDNLGRIKEIAKEVYQNAGQSFDFVEGNKANQHESVEAYKKTVEVAKEKSREIIEEANKDAQKAKYELVDQLYTKWEEDWDFTIKEVPDFKFDASSFESQYQAKIDRDFPRQFQLALKEVFELINQKAKQLMQYLHSRVNQLLDKENELEEKGYDLELAEYEFNKKVKEQNTNLADMAIDLGVDESWRETLIEKGGQIGEFSDGRKINEPFSELIPRLIAEAGEEELENMIEQYRNSQDRGGLSL
ncbi:MULTISPECIES: plasmid recombination protein [unclassified Lactococcus]|uniref:plasmid recombination protein n=1 Tax=unclassified Lactococcus TaxID=2643510 RepID=UPI0011C8CCFC|nr:MULTISPECIES: plasmid recombination protein [unclassified Lactococcus]MQW24094.1 hypothetical protein [Lactococcus sp. dk101]TXK36576.1 hypothetical protein FVP42_11140 [Lactococcus sp. dk310]TXK36582.1 hypothetical protein FVP42_11170 [Lactococcus sp. dk310]TXK46411.1 hypothetical protein FVP43_11025 [Lactococcus sp. dk322]TXK46417.1 hypothetical protein FVP43_11055 [Lactococcus sp. dk322]